MLYGRYTKTTRRITISNGSTNDTILTGTNTGITTIENYLSYICAQLMVYKADIILFTELVHLSNYQIIYDSSFKQS